MSAAVACLTLAACEVRAQLTALEERLNQFEDPPRTPHLLLRAFEVGSVTRATRGGQVRGSSVRDVQELAPMLQHTPVQKGPNIFSTL